MTEWISVKDRLPEKGVYVWCYSETRGMCADCFTGFIYPTGESEFRGTREEWDVTVTHWMPLPEPPKF